MSYYLISYDLNGYNKDYDSLFEEIEKINTATKCKPLESVWLIKSNLSAADIFDRLDKVIDNDDELLIIEVTNKFKSRSFKAKLNETVFKG